MRLNICLNKKGDSKEVMVVLVLAIIVAVALVYLLFGSSSNANNIASDAQIKSQFARMVSCKLNKNSNFVDIDKDTISDSCEICVGGNNRNDADSDGIADDCDTHKTVAGAITDDCVTANVFVRDGLSFCCKNAVATNLDGTKSCKIS